MSGDPEQEYFADGISEDIITGLSQFRWFFVIARNSTFTFKGRAVDIKQVARELGVRYVVEGSVRKAGQRVRVTAQLIDPESGAHLWAERYDRDYADIFAIQDEITQSVIGAIEPEIVLGEGRRAVRKRAENLDAFDCCMRGVWHFSQWNAEDSAQAETWLRQAIELEPKLARAHMCLARILFGRCWWGWSEDLRRDLPAASAAAERAVALDDRDPYGALHPGALSAREPQARGGHGRGAAGDRPLPEPCAGLHRSRLDACRHRSLRRGARPASARPSSQPARPFELPVPFPGGPRPLPSGPVRGSGSPRRERAAKSPDARHPAHAPGEPRPAGAKRGHRCGASRA